MENITNESPISKETLKMNKKRLANILKEEFLKTHKKADLKIKKLLKKPPGLPANLSKLEISKLEIDRSTLSVLCGTLLGDGSLQIQTNYRNARFQYRHSTRQAEWFMWKSLGPLKEFVGDEAIQFQEPDGEQKKTKRIGSECLGKLHLSSLTSEKLTSLHRIICKENKICIQDDWLQYMNAYFLMALWLDDGSLTNKRQGYFCLNSTPKSELDILIKYIKTVWEIDCKLEQLKENQYRIAISDEANLYKLMQVIAPLIPIKSMLYKVCFYPTNKTLLQHWTTEIKKLVRKEWHNEIDKQYFYHAICSTASVEDIVQ